MTTLNVEGIEAGMNPAVPASQTGILLLNHALVDWAEYFDPKIDDTVALNQSIEASLLARHPVWTRPISSAPIWGLKRLAPLKEVLQRQLN